MNPKRQSYESKYQMAKYKSNAAKACVGSGRITKMDKLAKAANKYRNITKSSQSFIDMISKHDHTTAHKYSTVKPINEESYKTTLTRNLAKNVKNEKSAEQIPKDSLVKSCLNSKR